jgi:hypothetical protein
MRAGLALMAATALIGGLTMIVIPRERNGDGDGRRGDDDVEQVAAAAVPAPAASAAAAFACRVDTTGIATCWTTCPRR